MSRLKMCEKKMEFVRKPQNYRILKRIHEKVRSTVDDQGGWLTPEIERLIERARREIGYSAKTVKIDIINALYVASRTGGRR